MKTESYVYFSIQRLKGVLPNTSHSARAQTGIAMTISTTECCLTKAVDSEIITAEKTIMHYTMGEASLLWQNTDAMATE